MTATRHCSSPVVIPEAVVYPPGSDVDGAPIYATTVWALRVH
ncbi:hypothetical protein [Brooklawnia cerclae]|uniref:Uncharacterized protein n=1 Tax=Brooklawnia cerclae TaxID=349934 RepID=A0ABX0SFX3_9ACTN|nr:hypothetical protein [Brooklawnia cerclae]NIH57283.1 hypothetical protein [Brooklawnia cerclae]